jgi:uncharacterized repeat protein (TIGR03803 family)
MGGTDGSHPLAGSLTRDSQGNLYGTAFGGGDSSPNCNAGCGVVFEVDPSGQETVLYSFTGGADGAGPGAGVIRDAAGNLYGTTVFGGAFDAGVVYKLDPAGNETVLYTFAGGFDGARPTQGNLVRDGEGNLYGTTQYGGNNEICPGGGGELQGCGVVYELDKAGQAYALYAFTGAADGSLPSSGVVRDSEGNLYGTTLFGGAGVCNNGVNSGCGVVFELTPQGFETVLCAFEGLTSGAEPLSLMRDSAGNFYGTTSIGAEYGYGVLFELIPSLGGPATL